MSGAAAKRGDVTVAMIIAATLAGCASTPDDPVATLNDRELPVHLRLNGMRAAEATAGGDPAFVASLHRLVWVDGAAVRLRLAAVDSLVRVHPASMWPEARARLARVDRAAVVDAVCAAAVDHATGDDRRAFVLAAVRSWARELDGVAEADRPEPRAIEAITGRPAIDTVEQVAELRVAEAGEADLPVVGVVDRAAAWVTLRRVAGEQGVRDRLEAYRAGRADPATLTAAVTAERRLTDRDRVGYTFALTGDTPASLEAFTRLVAVWDGWMQRHWPSLVERVAAGRWGDDAPMGPHELVLLAHAPGPLVGLDRGSLLAEARRSLRHRQHVARTGPTDPDEGAPVAPLPESIDDHAAVLTRGDLLAVVVLRGELDRPGLAGALFEQFDADHADTETEHGGVLRWDDDDRLVAEAFEPQLRRHDRAYYTPAEAVWVGYTGFAHYHFHAAAIDNAAWAGPGYADRLYVDRHGGFAVVFTAIDRDTLNADLYRGGDVVIDLGMVRRPTR